MNKNKKNYPNSKENIQQLNKFSSKEVEKADLLIEKIMQESKRKFK